MSMVRKEKTVQDELEDSVKYFTEEIEKDEKIPKEVKEKIKKGSKIQNFLSEKKRKFKNTKYRRKYDAILQYINNNLINTETYQTAMRSQSTGVAYSFVYENGSYTQVPILARNNANDNVTRLPIAKEPIAYSKIITGVSILAAKIPDGTFSSTDKIYSRTMYEMWKNTWADTHSNSVPTLRNFYQNLLGSGFGAYRVFPKKIEVPAKGTTKILYEGIYRQALDPSRVWVGNSVNIYDSWSHGEVLYEIDQQRDDFINKYPEAKYYDLEVASTNEDTGVDESVQSDFVTVRYYENRLRNKYCVACGNFVIYEGELPNDDCYGHVMWTNCFLKDGNDPYGVGLVELMRGNTEMYDYINRLTAEQIEAEISPLIFGVNTGLGDMTYRRGPNVINPKSQGTDIDVIKTSGNPQQSILFMDKQKQIIDSTTGINDIISGQAGEGTLGATVILKEAALNRLIIPRNNVIECLELDAYITVSWIRQTMKTRDYIKLTSEEVKAFIQANPDYFVQDVTVYDLDEDGNEIDVDEKEYVVSKKLDLGFDVEFDEENPEKDKIIETKESNYVPIADFFELLEEREHISKYLTITIDGTSMLLPSEEIHKQQVTELYTIVSPQLAQILQMKDQMSDMARAQMKGLERIIELYKESVYDWIPKDIYDAIMNPEPQEQVTPNMVAMSGMEQQAPEELDGMNTELPTPNDLNDPIGEMTQAFKSDFNKEIVNPMKGVMNASIGRAAKQ